MPAPTTHERIRLLEPGAVLGVSDWVVVSQNMICAFGTTTLDPDPMHIDPKWAAKHGPFGGAIAFGFLTISLLTPLLHSAVGSPPHHDPLADGYYLNYGFDRVRLVTPVPAGARVRGHFSIAQRREDAHGRWLTTIDCSIEIEAHERPALVAKWLYMWVPPRG